MDTRTGNIYSGDALQREIERRQSVEPKAVTTARTKSGSIGPRTTLKEIDPANLAPRVRRQLEATGRAQISRNSPCPCGSRKRFKRCCMTAAE